MTPTMMRVEAIILRIGSVGSGYTNTAAIAQEARCSRGYVSKLLSRFEAWGEIGIIRTRGRNGKLFMFARSVGDKLDHYMEEAKRRLHAQKVRRMARAMRRALNVSSIRSVQGMSNSELPTKYVMEETFTGFAREVIHERAKLALDDPDGEAEAVAPLTQENALLLWNATHPQRSASRAHDDAPLATLLGIPPTGRGRMPCPAHGEGKKPTLAWNWLDGRLLIHCFAGCTFQEIRQAAEARQ
jgi:hypothetical protein